ncbi:ovoinhibitor-like [Hyposmocoma kahamanoa]|uniref:ovoinhibitor-like n=1 Tax=Hyposmocoma kahamanoa TaxID=1477025 RepID=UPI000E6D62D5|nr:ovoinhibitor-like [Hyposmocoma kahamanoa]
MNHTDTLFLAIAVTVNSKSLRDKGELVNSNGGIFNKDDSTSEIVYDEEIRSDAEDPERVLVDSHENMFNKDNNTSEIVYDEEIRSDDEYPADYIDERFKKPDNGFSKFKPCRKRPCPTARPTIRPTISPSSPTPVTVDPMKDPAEKAKCLKECKLTKNFDPVCGSDGKTYVNPGQLKCARNCGYDVQEVSAGPCDNQITESPTSQSPIDPAEKAKCLRQCKITKKFDPVCGSDGKTYANPGHLECAKNCGFDVQKVSSGPCDNPITQSPTSQSPDTVQSIQNCIHKCPTLTPEYNPVCGTDGVTYKNPSKMQCARSCGVNVVLARRGRCPTSVVTSTEASTTTSRNPVDDKLKCLKTCKVSPHLYPICGSDGITYSNPSYLMCARKCGTDVLMVSEGRCPLNSTTTTTTTTTTATPIITTTELPADVRDCIKKCPVTTEHNPVCGSNGVTYENPGHFMCAHFCDIKVHFVSNGECAESTTVTSTTQIIDPEETARCVQNCPVTSEYNPKCGSNGVTYANPGRLECAAFCGVKVTEAYSGMCGSRQSSSTSTTTRRPWKDITAVNECIRKCPVPSDYRPVCGTDFKMYFSVQRLECVRNCGVGRRYTGSLKQLVSTASICDRMGNYSLLCTHIHQTARAVVSGGLQRGEISSCSQAVARYTLTARAVTALAQLPPPALFIPRHARTFAAANSTSPPSSSEQK